VLLAKLVQVSEKCNNKCGTLASFSFIALTIFDSSIDFIARLPTAHFQFCGAHDDDEQEHEAEGREKG